MNRPTKAAKASANAFLAEPLEYAIERPRTDVRVAHLRGSITGRRYGVVNSVMARRIIVSANACQHIRNPELLPDLLQALNTFFNARSHERPQATDQLWAAAIACGVLED